MCMVLSQILWLQRLIRHSTWLKQIINQWVSQTCVGQDREIIWHQQRCLFQLVPYVEDGSEVHWGLWAGIERMPWCSTVRIWRRESKYKMLLWGGGHHGSARNDVGNDQVCIPCGCSPQKKEAEKEMRVCFPGGALEGREGPWPQKWQSTMKGEVQREWCDSEVGNCVYVYVCEGRGRETTGFWQWLLVKHIW